MKSNKVEGNIHILLWCSPGFGFLDVWLPVVKILKERYNAKIDFVFPEPSSIKLEDKNSDLFNIAEQYVSNVIYRGYSGRWLVSSSLLEAHTKIQFSGFDEMILRFSTRLTKGRLSKYQSLKITGKYVSIIAKKIIYIKENFKHLVLYDFSLLSGVDCILYDITKEHKIVNRELTDRFKNTFKFSMLHGLSPAWLSSGFTCEHLVEKRLDVAVYCMSDLERDGYNKCFGVLDANIIHTGIPKQDKNWIKFICNKSSFDEHEPFVFIIGRPASAYMTVERKKQALVDIYDTVCNKYKLNLVIKVHPKESINGVDGKIYNSALGMDNYGKTWMFSDVHPFVLGKKSVFAISFYSGVVMDMLAIKKPVIEYLNLKGLPLYDNSKSLRDEYGDPVFKFRYAKLVLGASSKLELDNHVKSILNKYEDVSLLLYSKYRDYFALYNNASMSVAEDICKRINCSIDL
ncbi:hypothetical protein HOL24_04435 [bacterium]|jgi:hypothetical protein|nr:hypothetical protein [bacterium]